MAYWMAVSFYIAMSVLEPTTLQSAPSPLSEAGLPSACPTALSGYINYLQSFQNVCYFFATFEQRTNTAAKTLCSSYGGQLLAIESKDVWNFLVTQMNDRYNFQKQVWLDKVDTTRPDLKKLFPKERKSQFYQHSCYTFSSKNGGSVSTSFCPTWSSRYNGDVKSFICQFGTPEKKIAMSKPEALKPNAKTSDKTKKSQKRNAQTTSRQAVLPLTTPTSKARVNIRKHKEKSSKTRQPITTQYVKPAFTEVSSSIKNRMATTKSIGKDIFISTSIATTSKSVPTSETIFQTENTAPLKVTLATLEDTSPTVDSPHAQSGDITTKADGPGPSDSPTPDDDSDKNTDTGRRCHIFICSLDCGLFGYKSVPETGCPYCECDEE